MGTVLTVALALNFGFGYARGISRPMESDAYYYFQLAQSLAAGGGYVVRDGFWPEAPSMQRMPAWPAAVALALKLAPEAASPAAVMRACGLVVNAGVAVLVAVLAAVWFRRPAVALLAGLLYAVYPMALVCADEGLSEPFFLLLALGGALLLRHGLVAPDPAARVTRRLPFIAAGMLLLGAASLVRANFLLWIGFFGLGTFWWLGLRGGWRRPAGWAALALGALVFLAPPLLWAARNHRVCGAFPVLSTLRGQTFYGGNNILVASERAYWGYWVFPNQIPGERTLLELSRTMSEYEVDVYYTDRGRAFLRENPGRIPGLLLGKLVRAYVPVPWVWSVGSVGQAGIRAGFYLLVLAGLFRLGRVLGPGDRAILAAMVLTNAAMVLMFYGYSRFAFALEPFLMPFAAGAAVAILEALRSRRMATPAPGGA